MSDHNWVEEHVAAYLVGGLDAQEAERLEAHVRECPACAEVFAAARKLDAGISALFASARPSLGLEDRAIARLRADPTPKPLFSRWPVRVAAAVAAVLLLGTIGAFARAVVKGGLPMPGSERRELAEQARIAVLDGVPPDVVYGLPTDLTNEDFGLQTGLEAALPGLERVSKQTADAGVTQDNLGQPNSPDTNPTAWATRGLVSSHGGVDGTKWYAPTYDVGNLETYKASGSPAFYGNTFGSFTGRSGATHSQLAREGGGNERVPVQKTVTVLERGPTTGNGAPQFDPIPKPDSNGRVVPIFAAGSDGGNALGFKPSEYAIPVTKTVTRTENKPPVTVIVQKDPPKQPDKVDPQPVNPEPARRVILRSGDIEFEVPNYETAQATVHKLVEMLKPKGAFVADTKSDKQENGKVKGFIKVRVPPEHLDALVADLKKELGTTGTLKGVRLEAQDVTKQYYDLEGRLKGARTTEQRLLQIIKEGKGDIKAILEAEKELGVWRTKIEEFEGELRYYAAHASLSTLIVNIIEKDIRAAAGLTEKERVQAGVEVEDVDSAYQQLLKAIIDAKGRITKSEVKQVSAGQFNASMQFEVAPEAGGPMRDRLRQLGRVSRLQIDRVTEAEGGTLPTDAKLKHGDTVFMVQLYNLANVAPRETQLLDVAAPDVPTAYQALRDAIAKANGRVFNAQLNEQDRTNVTAQLDFEVRRADEPSLRTALDAAGEVVSRQVSRAPESENVTDGKVLFKTALLSAGRLKPREITSVTVEVENVDQTAKAFAKDVTDEKGRQVDSSFSRDRSGKVTAKLMFEVPLTAAEKLVERFKAAGTVRAFQSVKNAQASDGKYATARIEVTVTNRDAIIPDDDGIWPQIRRGLSVSVSVLLTSLTWVIFGLCVVLPWAVIAFVVYRMVRRRLRPATVPAGSAPTAA